ncbi:MAG: DUF4258 domain-containing protein [Pyrinomonadaceae bacterium]
MASEPSAILSLVRDAARKRILFLPHAIRQMLRPDRMITRLDIRSVVFEGEIIEDYPEDQRGHSCLFLGFDTKGRAIHVICSPKSEYLAIITAYLPDIEEWSDDFRQRI